MVLAGSEPVAVGRVSRVELVHDPVAIIGSPYPRRFAKQSVQYTGLPEVGWNGTWASRPQDEQVAANISRGPRS
jgi:hypothetical protein